MPMVAVWFLNEQAFKQPEVNDDEVLYLVKLTFKKPRRIPPSSASPSNRPVVMA